MIKKYIKIDSDLINTTIWIIFAIIVFAPVLYVTRFSYPCQDDFSYATIARNLMGEGYSLFGQAWYMVKEWHMIWGGLYSSTFFGYLFSGIALCSSHQIRIIEFIIGIIYAISLLIFVCSISVNIFKLRKRESLTVYSFLLIFLYGVVYYGDFDVFYWFITSVQYLLLLAFSVSGAGLYLAAASSKNRGIAIILAVCSSVLGFIASGANLCLAALNVYLYFAISVFVIIYSRDKKQRKIVLICIPVIMGALINGLAPGNTVRAGGGKTIADIVLAIESSIRYAKERMIMFLKMPEFWLVLFTFVVVSLFWKRKRDKKRIGLPGIIIWILISLLASVGIIFPAMLGYGYDVFVFLIRGQVLLDFVLFVSLVTNILLLEQWLASKVDYKIISEMKKYLFIAWLCILGLFGYQERDSQWRWIGVVRNYRDLSADRFGNYASFYLDILNQMENSTDDIVVIYIDEEVKEKTSQVNPLLEYDNCYDPEVEYNGNAISQYYGRKGAWILHSDYIMSEEEMALLAKYNK